jgi:hypothetical protein
MSNLFSRIITFHVTGEIYNSNTTPEDVINSYDWTFEDSVDGNIQIFAHHNDDNGKITEVIKMPKIHHEQSSDADFSLNV